MIRDTEKDTLSNRARMEADDMATCRDTNCAQAVNARIIELEAALYELAAASLAFRILAAKVDRGVERRLQKAIDRAKALTMKEGR